MAKGKSKNGNPAVNSKKENIERFKERAKAAKVKSAEDQWKDMLAAMSEEEAKAFLAQLDVAAKEADLAEREQAIKDIQAGFGDIETELDNRDTQQGELQEVLDGRESAVQERETAVGARETKADKKDSELMGRERSIIEREANAENEFAIQNRKALDALRKRKEELDAEILALEQKKIEKEDTLEQQIEGLRKAKLEALDAEIADLSEKRRVAAKAEAKQTASGGRGVVRLVNCSGSKSAGADAAARLRSAGFEVVSGGSGEIIAETTVISTTNNGAVVNRLSNVPFAHKMRISRDGAADCDGVVMLGADLK